MKKIVILALLLLASIAYAGSNGVFRVSRTTNKVKGNYLTTNAVPENINDDLYNVIVTPAQYASGWDALPIGIKTNALIAADSYRATYTNWSAREQASLDTFLVLYNDIAPAGKQITKAEMIEKVKKNTKKPKKGNN